MEGLESSIPKPLYLKRVEVLGKEAYAEPFHMGSGPLNIVLGSDSCTLVGNVTADNRGAPGAMVVLLDVSAGIEPAPNELMVARADSSGTFRFESLPPHEYLIAGFNNLHDEQEWNPKVIKAVRGAPARVRPSTQSQVVSVKVIQWE